MCFNDTKQTKASTHKGGGLRLAPKRQPGLIGLSNAWFKSNHSTWLSSQGRQREFSVRERAEQWL
ncbi:hypothetical protein SynROS8604_02353 [Synechococcus sp. ROS8604]|nr:hypothetical protein SynROS8604_02353 [Synechococcus sp. ROS8604]